MAAGFGMAGDFIQGPGVEAAGMSGEAAGRAAAQKLKSKL
jgi:predicted NAD/FAD-dependent oxidoreductase